MTKKIIPLLFITALATLTSNCTSEQKTQLVLKEDSKLRKTYEFKDSGTLGEASLSFVSTSEMAENVMHAFVAGIKTSFENRSAPYAGHITADIDCVARKYLREQSVPFGETQARLVLAVANDRQLSVCSVEQIQYVSGFWTTYNKNKQQVLSIKIFQRVTRLDTIEDQQQDLLSTLQKIASQIP